MKKFILFTLLMFLGVSFPSKGNTSMDGLTLNVTVCQDFSSVRITGEAWGWSSSACPPLTNNGDGSWSITFGPQAPFLDTVFVFLFVADGELEDLVSNNSTSNDWSCTDSTDSATYAYRLWVPGTENTINATFNTCGECGELALGCTDSLACNYDSAANLNDGSCVFPDVGYDCSGVCILDTDSDGVCDEFELAGCTQETAINYDSAATDDDGSCVFEYNVTFQLDLRGQTDLIYSTPELNGIFNEWCGNCAQMTDEDNDSIWQITVPILEGSGPVAGVPGWEYKFSADNWNIQESLFDGDPCTYTAFGYTNRYINVTQDTILDPVCWGSCVDCYGPQSSYDVTFRLDMTNMSDFVTPEVNGTFNNWCGSCWPMSDDNSDGIWDFTTSVDTSFHEFKFSADNWGIQEQLDTTLNCVTFLIDSVETIYVNRYLQVYSDTVLDIVCWNDCVECDSEVVSDSTFNCDTDAGCVYTGDNPTQPGEFSSLTDCQQNCNNSSFLSELDENNKVSIFPNPSNGFFNIESDQQVLELVIYNKLGSRLLVVENPGNKTQINLPNNKSELFFVEIFLHDQIIRRKLINR